jgi:PAS domain S-box-containing protein
MPRLIGAIAPLGFLHNRSASEVDEYVFSLTAAGVTSDNELVRIIRQAIEAVPNAMIVVDRTGRVVMTNAHAEAAFGYGRNEILGWPIQQLVEQRIPGRTPPASLPFLINAFSAATDPRHELYASHKDGHEFLIEIGLARIETSDGPLVIIGIADISGRQQEAARIRAALTEKDVLLREIHHRVKNNLQIVSSLLDLQAAQVSDQATRDLLRDSQNRIHSMALIHQTLYGSTDFESVDFAQFSETLLSLLIRSYGIDAGRITIRVEVEPLRLPIDVAVPCGLVVNELITNAFKHAFANRDHGEIRIALTRQSGNEVLLSVSDNGIGLPDNLDIGTTETIGLQLVHMLAMQLDGEITIHRSNPTQFSLLFQIGRHPEAT